MRALKITQQITIRESAALDTYLKDINKIKLITIERERELSIRISDSDGNDTEAIDELVNSNLRFVVSVSKQYQNQGLSLQDLINEGNIGLIKAAKKYDHSRGFKFITYAVWWIRQGIMQALADKSRVVRLPINHVSKMNKIKKLLKSKEQELGREASINELNGDEINQKDINAYVSMNKKPLYVDSYIGEDGNSRYIDTMTDENSLNPETPSLNQSLKDDLNIIIGTLQPKQIEIVKLFYGIGCKKLKLEEISEIVKLAPDTVRQKLNSAIWRMRYNAKNMKHLSQHL